MDFFIRDIINEAVKDAMRSKEKLRLSTLRLINAAIKDKDIALRMEDRPDGVSSSEILQILGKMVKQRQESARAYEEGGRLELAQQELSEIKIIEERLTIKTSKNMKKLATLLVLSCVNAVVCITLWLHNPKYFYILMGIMVGINVYLLCKAEKVSYELEKSSKKSCKKSK